MANEIALISRDNVKLSLAFTDEALRVKEAVLTIAAPIAEVTDAASNQTAVEAQQALAKLRQDIEKGREEAVKPFVKAQRDFNEQAKLFIADVLEEEHRITKLIGSYFQLQENNRLAAERAARMEREEAERQKQEEAMRVMRENAAKQAKLDADAAAAMALANRAKNEAQRKAADQAQAEIERQRALADAATHDQLNQINKDFCDKAAQTPTVFEQPKLAKGQSIKKKLVIQVTDIWTLARAHPTCVRIEPLVSEIESLIKAGVKVAGVTFTEEMVSQTLGRGGKTIDV